MFYYSIAELPFFEPYEIQSKQKLVEELSIYLENNIFKKRELKQRRQFRNFSNRKHEKFHTKAWRS
jgi:hypothetical protein